MRRDHDDAHRRRTAARQVDAKLSFRIHLFVYLIVNAGLLLLNLATSPGYLWCLWSLFGWGVGLIAHAYAVYGLATRDREGLIAAEVTRLQRDKDGAVR